MDRQRPTITIDFGRKEDENRSFHLSNTIPKKWIRWRRLHKKGKGTHNVTTTTLFHQGDEKKMVRRTSISAPPEDIKDFDDILEHVGSWNRQALQQITHHLPGL